MSEINLTEKNSRVCKQCMKLRARIPAGKWGNSKDKKWLDENGFPWNGSVCGWCNKLRIRNAMNTKNAKKRAEKEAARQARLAEIQQQIQAGEILEPGTGEE